MPVDLGLEAGEHRAEPDGGAVHEDEFARRGDAAKPPEFPVDLLRHRRPVNAALGVLDAPHLVVHQRRVDELGPEVEHVDDLAAEVLEAPGLVGMDREILLAPRQRPVEVDDAGDELRLEHPDAAEVEQVEGVIGPRRIIAEMGIAVDDAVTIEGHVPRQEHVMRQLVAAFDMGVGEGQQRLALEPGHAQQPAGRKLIDRHRHVHAVLAFEHRRIKTHVQRFAPVVQFLMQAFDDLGVDFARRDGGVDALVYGEGEPELPEIGIDHRFHVRVLQFAGKPRAVVRQRFVHLAERRRPRRDVFEFGEALPPIGPQFRRHAPLDEQPAHGRRVGLQMPEFRGVFRRQGVGHGGEELRHLHQRPLDAAERGAQLRRVAGPVELEAEIARPGKAHGEPADRGRDLGVAAEAPG